MQIIPSYLFSKEGGSCGCLKEHPKPQWYVKSWISARLPLTLVKNIKSLDLAFHDLHVQHSLWGDCYV